MIGGTKPKVFSDYSDTRNKAWCIYCSCGIGTNETNRDHVPSKSLLLEPYPENPMVVKVCSECNESYSLDEEYFAAFLSAVLSGSTVPSEQKLKIGRRVFDENRRLKRRIDASRKDYVSEGGKSATIWEPETKRIHRVVTKLARAHMLFENGEPMLENPVRVDVVPIKAASKEQTQQFFPEPGSLSVWPEVGSRWMWRLFEETCWDQDGYYVLQPSVYRYRLDLSGGAAVRIILHDFLACSVVWEIDHNRPTKPEAPPWTTPV